MIVNLLKARLREPSTWAGLALLLQALPHVIATRDPLALINAIGGAAAIFMREKGAEVSQEKL